MEHLSVGVSHCSSRHTLQVSREHRQVIAYRQAKERSSCCVAQIQEGPAVAPLGMCHGILQRSGDGATNCPMSTFDPNTNVSRAIILPCCSHRLSLVWWWTHPAPTSWMMQTGSSVHPNLSRLNTLPQPQPPLQFCPSRTSCSLQFPCSWVFQVALAGVTEPWVTYSWSDSGSWWSPWD